MQKRGSKTGLFLMELLLVILFFSIASAVCLRGFAAAWQKSRDSADLGGAVLAAQSAAEYWKAAGGDPVQTAALMKGTLSGNRIGQCYDADWVPVDSEQAVFCLQLNWDGASAEIQVARLGGAVLYTLQVQSLGGGPDA